MMTVAFERQTRSLFPRLAITTVISLGATVVITEIAEGLADAFAVVFLWVICVVALLGQIFIPSWRETKPLPTREGADDGDADG